jgi:GTP-binding protein
MNMKPTVVLVGRPNVGKSTLFNRLTRSRDALVADLPGLTRDRHYGDGRLGGRGYFVVDTGGLEPVAKEGMLGEMAKQTASALAEADAVIFIVDGRDGLAPQDRRIGEELRRLRVRVWVAVNKAEGMDPAIVTAEFHELALGPPHAISAAHGDGVHALLDEVLAEFPPEEAGEPPAVGDAPRIAVVGRERRQVDPVNRFLGEDRMIVYDGPARPGRHRGAVRARRRVRPGRHCGCAAQGRVFSRSKILGGEDAACDRPGERRRARGRRRQGRRQDAHLAGYVLERGRAIVVAANKWDSLDQYEREQAPHAGRKLAFLASPHHFLGFARPSPVLASVEAYRAATARLPTPKVTRALIDAVARQAPPRAGLVRPKLRYAHQGGVNPPIIVVHGTALASVPASYRRYLEGVFRKAFGLVGTPLRIEFKTGRNPYVRQKS